MTETPTPTTPPTTAPTVPTPDERVRRLSLIVRMEDGTVHDVLVGNPDMVRYDEVRARNQWPTALEGPILWQTFTAWAALTRTRKLDGMPWEAFKVAALEVDRAELVDVDPSRGTAEAG